MIGEAATETTACAAQTPIVAALAAWPGRTVGELADATGLAPAAVRQELRELCRRGIAWCAVSGPEAGRWRLTTDAASGA
jgi:predicted ArsR family transcriptional regulator